MAILSKLLFFICIFPTWLFGATYIQHVDVSQVDDKPLQQELVRRYKGAVVDDSQIKSVLNRLYLRGVYRSIDYSIDSYEDNHQIKFIIKRNPIVKTIIFNTMDLDLGYIKRNMKTRVGQPYNYNFISDDVAFINDYLSLQGYFMESVRDITINDSGALSVHIESPRLKSVQLIGLERTKPFVVYRELIIDKGDRINHKFLNIDSDSLGALPYFSSVSSPMVDAISSEDVRVTYQFKERKINRIDFGLEELENDQGVALFSKFKLYHAFIYSDFIMLQAQLGYLNQLNIRTYKIHYQQPWLFNRYQFVMDFTAYTSYRSEIYQGQTASYDTVRSGYSFFLTRPVKRYFLKAGAGINVETVYPQVVDAFESYNLHAMAVYVEMDRVDSVINPKNGYRTRFNVDRGGRIFGINFGGIDFTRFSVRHSQYIPLQESFTFAYRLFGGYYKKISSTPTFETEKFSLGGSNSLRGYHEFSFYGDYRLSVNIEPRYQFNDFLMGVAFIDAGYISDSLQSNFRDSFHVGYGIGARFLNSFLPFRIDLAYGNDLMVHFNVSQTF